MDHLQHQQVLVYEEDVYLMGNNVYTPKIILKIISIPHPSSLVVQYFGCEYSQNRASSEKPTRHAIGLNGKLAV